MVQLSFVSKHFVRVFTCVLVPALADTRCRVGRGAITPRKKQGCTFHCEEALTNTRREEKKKRHELKPQTQALMSSYLNIFGLCVMCVFINV